MIAPLPFPTSGADEVAEAFLAGVTARTRLAVISHLTSPSALRLPVERLVSELAARGVDTLVDGAHAPGQIPLSLDALGAAYYTGNGHKWLCGPKGTGFLWVRADRRAAIHPTVTSHGANDPRVDRPRFRLEFDWVGTGDPTGILTLPAAIEWMASQEPGGWPAVIAANHALAISGRDAVAAAIGVPAPAPDDRLGAMASLPLPGVTTNEAAVALYEALIDEDGIEVPITGFPARGARPSPADDPRQVFVRLSAQRYNEPADYDRLASALTRRLIEA